MATHTLVLLPVHTVILKKINSILSTLFGVSPTEELKGNGGLGQHSVNRSRNGVFIFGT